MKYVMTALVLGMTICTSGAVLGGPRSAYIGATFGTATTARDNQDSAEASLFGFDERDGAETYLIGIRPLDWFAVELSEMRLGEIVQTVTPCCDWGQYYASQDAVAVVGVLIKHTKPIDLKLEIGLARWNADSISVQGLTGARTDASQSGTDMVLGVGIQRAFGKLAIRADYAVLDYRLSAAVVPGAFERPRVATVGLTWDFL